MRSATSGRARSAGTCQRSAAGIRHTLSPLLLPTDDNAIIVLVKSTPSPHSLPFDGIRRFAIVLMPNNTMRWTTFLLYLLITACLCVSLRAGDSQKGHKYESSSHAPCRRTTSRRTQRAMVIYQPRWRQLAGTDQSQHDYGSSVSLSNRMSENLRLRFAEVKRAELICAVGS